MDKLGQIVKSTRRVVELAKQVTPLQQLKASELYSRETSKVNSKTPLLIAEFKRKSPSKGILNEQATVDSIVPEYFEAGAGAVSVLTDQEFFAGTLDDLRSARARVDGSLLRKDFMIDPYQIHEAKAHGADIILLIARILSKKDFHELASLAKDLDLTTLVEIHSTRELEGCDLDLTDILGVNNRNLKDFRTDYRYSLELLPDLPKEKCKISESGISSAKEAAELINAGFDGLLIGEQFMKTDSPGKACAEFLKELGNEL